MRLMASFFRTYRLQTLLMLLALLLSGIAEGVGLSALLPLVNIALGSGVPEALPGVPAQAQNDFERLVLDLLDDAGIAPTLGNMLWIIVTGVTLKSIFLLLAQRQVGYTAAQVGTDLRLEMLRAVLRSKWEYFLHQPVGKLTNSLATEAQRSSASFVHGATAITFLYPDMHNFALMTTAIFIGGVLAWWTGKRVAMTDMPQMIALYNGMGGGSAAAISAVELLGVRAFVQAPPNVDPSTPDQRPTSGTRSPPRYPTSK